MSTQKAKFELFTRLQALGFTHDEAASLRRIEMTLQRWAEAECKGEIQREDETGKPRRVLRHSYGKGVDARYPIADREAGALTRLHKLCMARNARVCGEIGAVATSPNAVLWYHQGDCRGCMLYLLTRAQLTQDGKTLPVDQYYNRGLAVCA
tara:strand:+ start:714 stop:1169 length:456 start_codon:yes stop_codon:yes gene_type:complete